MDNIILSLSEEYPKFSIEKQKSPSYVSLYTKKSDDVVLVYFKNKPSTFSTIRSNPNDEREELELTGSPLKLDLSLHTILDETLPSDEPQLWNKDEGQHLPVALKQAREIANTYNNTLRNNVTESPIPMWVLTAPSENQKTLLLNVQSYKDHFVRGIVTFEGTFSLDDIDMEELVAKYAEQEGISSEMVSSEVDCKFVLSGVSYAFHPAADLPNAPHGAASELHCEWSAKALRAPMSCRVHLEQEVIIGHHASPCNSIWKSICALHKINQLLVDMTVAGFASVNLEHAQIRHEILGAKRPNNTKRLNELLNEVETYAYMAQCPPGGCLFVTEDTTSLGKSLRTLDLEGSSNDFTYKLWDILKESETAEELVSLLIHALKFISSRKIRPFIDANNKTYLAKLVTKLSRGHSQTAAVLSRLRASPPQPLSLLAQVGVEKTVWEYTHAVSLLEHSFYMTAARAGDAKTHESIEQINQTIQDMTMSGGDFSLNPFESLSTPADHSIRLDCESFYDDETNGLNVDDFASLKKHGLTSDKKVSNEVPLIADEIDISPWKSMLSMFAQVHVCLEHLYRAEACLRADFASLKPLATYLLEVYLSDKSPVKTVGQLMNEPVQKIIIPVANNVVKDHLKKPVYWYRVTLDRKENASNVGLKRESKQVYLFTQQPVFPPNVWQYIEPPNEEVAEMTTIGEELKYHCTKYTHNTASAIWLELLQTLYLTRVHYTRHFWTLDGAFIQLT